MVGSTTAESDQKAKQSHLTHFIFADLQATTISFGPVSSSSSTMISSLIVAAVYVCVTSSLLFSYLFYLSVFKQKQAR